MDGLIVDRFFLVRFLSVEVGLGRRDFDPLEPFPSIEPVVVEGWNFDHHPSHPFSPHWHG